MRPDRVFQLFSLEGKSARVTDLGRGPAQESATSLPCDITGQALPLDGGFLLT